MTNTPKNKVMESPSIVEDSSTNFSVKRTWISPDLQNWNLQNIENGIKGTLVDGAFALTYNT